MDQETINQPANQPKGDYEITIFYFEKILGTTKNGFAVSLYPNQKRKADGGSEENHAAFVKKQAVINTINSMKGKGEVTHVLRQNFEKKTGLDLAEIRKAVAERLRKIEGPGEDVLQWKEKYEEKRIELIKCTAEKQTIERMYDKTLAAIGDALNGGGSLKIA